jgi:pimeloyl-ACP methyl ester carboxylesterase
MENVDRIAPRDVCLEVNRLNLHYLDWGNCENQTILLLHGFMGHAHVWDDLAEELVGHCYNVLALDQRGHGESQWSEKGEYRIDDFFADIADFVEQLKLRDLILIGHSMGGRNALFYSACAAEKVSRLILVDARVGNSPASSSAFRQLLNRLPLQSASLDEIVHLISGHYPDLSADTCRHLAAYGYKKIDGDVFVPRYDTKMSLECQQQGFRVEEMWPFLENVSCPVLVVRGEDSPFVSREDAIKMCDLLARAEWREIPRATHMPVQENPDACKKVFSDFLAACYET